MTDTLKQALGLAVGAGACELYGRTNMSLVAAVAGGSIGTLLGWSYGHTKELEGQATGTGKYTAIGAVIGALGGAACAYAYCSAVHPVAGAMRGYFRR